MTIAAAAVFVLIFAAEVAKPYRIPSPSMEPTLRCAKPQAWCTGAVDDRVVANRLAYRFTDPDIGLPGDQVSERDGYVFVNGRPLHEPYVEPALRDHETKAWPRDPQRRYFFMGDDRAGT